MSRKRHPEWEPHDPGPDGLATRYERRDGDLTLTVHDSLHEGWSYTIKRGECFVRGKDGRDVYRRGVYNCARDAMVRCDEISETHRATRKKSKTRVDNDWDPPHVQSFHGTPPNHHPGTRDKCVICKKKSAARRASR